MKKIISRLFITVFILSVTATLAFAKPGSTPNGPWVTPNQNISLEAFHNYEELTDKLMKIEKSSKGLVKIDEAGVTGGERSIWLVKIGDPDNMPVLPMVNEVSTTVPTGTLPKLMDSTLT